MNQKAMMEQDIHLIKNFKQGNCYICFFIFTLNHLDVNLLKCPASSEEKHVTLRKKIHQKKQYAGNTKKKKDHPFTFFHSYLPFE